MSRAFHTIAHAAHNLRRNSELLRKSQRTALVPVYLDLYNDDGTLARSIYVRHRLVPYRNIQHKPTGFATLMASVSRIDLTRASGAQLAEWARV